MKGIRINSDKVDVVTLSFKTRFEQFPVGAIPKVTFYIARHGVTGCRCFPGFDQDWFFANLICPDDIRFGVDDAIEIGFACDILLPQGQRPGCVTGITFPDTLPESM